MAALCRRELLAYGALGLPLAFAALPLYVHLPRLYADGLGLPLAGVGAVLLAARIVDAAADPLIGWACDRLRGRRTPIVAALPLLGLGLPALLAPPAGAGLGWLLAVLVLVSFGYSLAAIAHAAWGAEVAPTPALRTRVVASREGFALAGVVLAAVLPGLLAGMAQVGGEAGGGVGAAATDEGGTDLARGTEALGLARLAWAFPPLLLGLAAWTLLAAPAVPPRAPARQPLRRGLGAVLGEPAFARLLAVFAANGIAAAIPSATVLFFVADVLRAPQFAGLFLALYFVAAAAGLPLWAALSRRFGKLRAWAAAMALAAAVFAWAGLLDAGALLAYGLICVLAGLALGAELVLPAALLADLLARPAAGAAGAGAAGAAPDVRAGACFGWWNFVAKANLALAAGLALPLLALLGYQPGARAAEAVRALAAVYAFVPVLLKLGALALLWHWRNVLEPGGACTVALAPAGDGGRS